LRFAHHFTQPAVAARNRASLLDYERRDTNYEARDATYELWPRASTCHYTWRHHAPPTTTPSGRRRRIFGETVWLLIHCLVLLSTIQR